MTGPSEQKLIALAEGGEPFDVPVARELVPKLETLKSVVAAAAQLPGIEGDSADAASAAFTAASGVIGEQIRYLENNLRRSLDEANGLRAAARERLANLPAGSLTPGQAAVVRGAAAGTTLMLGPLALFAGEGAMQAFDGYLRSQREAEAERSYNGIAQEMRAVRLKEPPTAAFHVINRDSTTDGEDNRNDGDDNRRQSIGGDPDGRLGYGSPTPDVDSLPASQTHDFRADIPPHLIPNPQVPRGPGIDLGQVPPNYQPPTVDGPVNGTAPGYTPGLTPGGLHGGGLTGGGPHGGSMPGTPAAGVGSGLTAGLIAGAGGAAALRKLGRVGGASSVGTATGRSLPGSGGLSGKTTGNTGGGLGVRGGGTGVGTTGGAAGTAGAGGATAGARGAGMRGGLGTGAPAGTGTTGTGPHGSAGATSAGGRGGSGMGGGGSRSNRGEEGRGGGGPIAPRMEDEDEIGPRSTNAGAGSRDRAPRDGDELHG